MNSSHGGLIRLVAMFKLVKAAILIIVGIGILKLIHTDVARQREHWPARLGLDSGSRFVNQAIEKVTSLSPDKIKDLGIVNFV